MLFFVNPEARSFSTHYSSRGKIFAVKRKSLLIFAKWTNIKKELLARDNSSTGARQPGLFDRGSSTRALQPGLIDQGSSTEARRPGLINRALVLSCMFPPTLDY